MKIPLGSRFDQSRHSEKSSASNKALKSGGEHDHFIQAVF
jgi:hypothetical protein